jgi:hypothetical protein
MNPMMRIGGNESMMRIVIVFNTINNDDDAWS